MTDKNQNGYALVSVIIIVMILLLVMFSIITITFFQARLIRKDANELKAHYLAEAGIYKVLANKSLIANYMNSQDPVFSINTKVDTFDVKIDLFRRGGFLKITSAIFYKGLFLTLSATVGQQMPNEMNAAIILNKPDYPLIVTGNNKIVGNVKVGPRGVKSGTIKDIRFTGANVVNGTVLLSNKSQGTVFNPALFSTSKTLLSQQWLQPNCIKINQSITIDESNSQLLEQNPNLCVLGDLIIGNMAVSKACSLSATGNILINAQKSIPARSILFAEGEIIAHQGQFDETLLYARNKITLSGPITGNAQLFSYGQIELNSGARLTWPSVIFVSPDTSMVQPQECVQLLNGSSLTGSIILWSTEEKGPLQESRIIIDDSSFVHGMIYTNQVCDFRGKMIGTITTDMFYLYISPTHYINWLLNTEINHSLLEFEFIIPLWFGTDPLFSVINWKNEKVKNENPA